MFFALFYIPPVVLFIVDVVVFGCGGGNCCLPSSTSIVCVVARFVLDRSAGWLVCVKCARAYPIVWKRR